VKDRSEIAQVGTISANGDEEIGALLADAIEKVGKDGVITVEEAKGMETELDVVEGMQFDKGFISPYFITNPDKMLVVLEDAHILIYEKKISNIRQILPILEAVAQKGAPLLIIAEDVEQEALATLVVNRLRGVMKVAAVKAPGFGDRRKAMLEDIGILTGGQCITEDLGQELENISVEALGFCKRIEITKDNTLIVEGAGTSASIKERIGTIQTQIEKSSSDYDREKLTERLGKLTGGVAVVRVGAATEKEMNEKKARVEDGLHATRAAADEGIVPGGGTALLRTLGVLEECADALEGDAQMGARIVTQAVKAPARQIAKNAGFDGGVAVDETLSSNEVAWGFNAATGVHEDMLKAGIADPVKVTKSALQNAGSVSGLMLTISAAITSFDDKKTPVSGAVT